jgi:hypothetical protein
LKPKWAQSRKGNKKTTTIVHDLGFDYEDQTKVATMGIKGKSTVVSFSSPTSSSKSKVIPDGRQRKELFHLQVISKHINIDTLFDSGSQVNLVSEQVVQKLVLETRPHPRPYPLGWIFDNSQLQVTKQCKLQFMITSNFIDEVELDVVPLDICGMVLGSLYLYDMKAIFYREHNKYNFFKDGIKFIVRAHQMKTNLIVITTRHMLANASIQDPDLQPTVEIRTVPLVDVVPIKKGIYVDGSFSFTSVHSVLLIDLLLISGIWLATATMNGKFCEFKGMVNLVSNVVSVFIMVVMNQVLIIQAGWMDDTR